MQTLVAQLAALLTISPGNLAYHLALAFCIAGALSSSLFQAPPSPNILLRRLHTGLVVLLGIQGLLFLLNNLSAERALPLPFFLPVLDRAFSLMSLLILAWLWLAPFPLRREASSISAVFVVWAALLGGALALASHSNPAPYNAGGQEIVWQAGMAALGLAAVWISATRRLPGWGLGASAFAVLSAGHLVQAFLPLPQGDLPGFARLADLAAFPFLFALPARPLFSNRLDARPNPFAVDRRRRSTDPATLNAFLELADHSQPAAVEVRAARAIAHALVADCCYLLAPPDQSGQLTLSGGYDLIQDAPLPGATLDAASVPSLAEALRKSRALLEDCAAGQFCSGNILAEVIHLGTRSSLLFQPFPAEGSRPGGGILLLAPYSHREWTAADQAYLAPAAEVLSRLAAPQAAPSAREEEKPGAQAGPPAVDVATLLALQQELQEAVERMQEENGRLRSALIASGQEVPPPVRAAPAAPGIPRDRIDLPRLVSSGLDCIRDEITRRELLVALDLPDELPEVETDEKALLQIADALLRNAASVSPVRGEITLRARLQNSDARSPVLILQVTDRGGGIAPADVALILDPSPEGMERDISGASVDRLGLQFALALVQSLGGRMGIEPHGDTSTTSVLIPVECPAIQPVKIPAA